MAAVPKEVTKKKLTTFLAELLKIGCVKGFKHFAMHLRGREELICSIVNKPSVPILLSASNSPGVSMNRNTLQMLLPRDGAPRTLNQKLQRRLSGYGFINVGLPPASPSDEEVDHDENTTMFLIAGYSKYSCPYVWVRSNHERIILCDPKMAPEKDFPLNLITTSEWREKDIKVWDVIAELVNICADPCPANPFEVDFDYFEALPLVEKYLASGAMVNILRKIISTGPHGYDKRILKNLQTISSLHFHSLGELSEEGRLPLFQESLSTTK